MGRLQHAAAGASALRGGGAGHVCCAAAAARTSSSSSAAGASTGMNAFFLIHDAQCAQHVAVMPFKAAAAARSRPPPTLHRAKVTASANRACSSHANAPIAQPVASNTHTCPDSKHRAGARRVGPSDKHNQATELQLTRAVVVGGEPSRSSLLAEQQQLPHLLACTSSRVGVRCKDAESAGGNCRLML